MFVLAPRYVVRTIESYATMGKVQLTRSLNNFTHVTCVYINCISLNLKYRTFSLRLCNT